MERERQKKLSRRRSKGRRGIVFLAIVLLIGTVCAVNLVTKGRDGGDVEWDQLTELSREYPQIKDILHRAQEYPPELLELLLRNQETVDFVYSYPDEKDSVPPDTVGHVIQGEFPLLMQWDKRWGYVEYGDGMIALTGCGPTTLAMAVCGLTGQNTITPVTVANYAAKAGYYAKGVGSKWTLMSEGCREFGLVAQELPLVRGKIVNALESGSPVICSMRAGDFTTSGHFILLTGMEDGQFRVNDPNSRANSERLWDYDTLAPQISNLWAFTLG